MADSSKLNLYIHPELKRDWLDYCARLRKKPSVVIRDLISNCINTNADSCIFSQQESIKSESKCRVEIRLTKSEKEKIEQLAAIERCSIQTWIILTIRASITREPQFGMTEIEALGESNYQLLALGRNLNQIARKLNEGEIADFGINELLVSLKQQIERHTDLVDKALRACIERWGIE